MENDLKRIIGHRLQTLRVARNLTQEQMGEKLNLSTSAYCKMEYGETDLTLTRLNKIADIFEIPAVELFSRINGEANFNNCQGIIGYTQHNENVNVGNTEDLRELIKANTKMIEMLAKRMDMIEQRQLV